MPTVGAQEGSRNPSQCTEAPVVDIKNESREHSGCIWNLDSLNHENKYAIARRLLDEKFFGAKPFDTTGLARSNSEVRGCPYSGGL